MCTFNVQYNICVGVLQRQSLKILALNKGQHRKIDH